VNGEGLIAALRCCIDDGQVTLQVLPLRESLREWSWREIAVRRGDHEVVVPVDNEYGDADQPNPTAWLHLVLTSLLIAEEEPDIHAWFRAVGLPENAETEGLYRAICAAQTPVRAWVGPDLRPVPESDIEFNTGLAKALRACVLPSSPR
jgi:hypothetical protein